MVEVVCVCKLKNFRFRAMSAIEHFDRRRLDGAS